MCEWLCRFFTEVRKSDGSHYCPRSLSSILAGLQRHIHSTSPHSLKIQDQEGEFKPLHVLLENLYKELHEQGVDALKAQARIITRRQGFGKLVPSVLATLSMQYLNALRGGAEHRNLCISQLTFNKETIDYVEYTEFGSKNRPGGREQLNKTVHFILKTPMTAVMFVYM